MLENRNIYDVIVVGAGASGIMAAGRAAQMGARVLLLEKMRQAGRKILITGKGRCNITHDAPEPVYYQNIFPKGKFLKHAFSTFFVDDIIKILHDRGVETTTERGSRVFPLSNQAKDVLNALLDWMGKTNIDVIYNCKTKDLIIESGVLKGVHAETDNGPQEFLAGKVILCTGGKSYPATGSSGDGYSLAQQAGHSLSDVRPALVPLVTKGDIAGKLQGLSLKNVKAVVWVNGKKTKEDFGELMFAHYGLTGPIILSLSRHVVEEMENNSNVEISIDLKPALYEKKLDARLLRDLNEHGKKYLENIFKLWLPSSLIPVFLEQLELDRKKLCHQVSSRERRKILLLMKDFRFQISGHPGYKEAIVTAGGVPTNEISSKTLESKLINGLYFAGELIDLDGNTGGFNLQIAFSTGWLAGQESAK
ncbi:MAG: NAD(P)/FAD-dependent oxidoreductase [Bacteroidales bacterium]